ncbi:MAG TPA: hypothetical protein VFJ06_10345 [Halococcus sp.]|nr:hypothetical protein [Halococcus sp.]
MADTDAVMNAETRRALRRRGRQIGMVAIGVAVAIVLFGVAGLAAILSIPWQLSRALTVGVTVALPLAVPYAMLRVLGLSHRDVIYVGRQAYREVVAEVIALSGTQQTAAVFTENAVNGENSPSEAEEMNADEASTEHESTAQPQQAEPTPDPQS